MPEKTTRAPKTLKVKSTAGVVKGVRWRNPEERKAAKRKIEAIRRAAEKAHLEQGAKLNLTALRSPKFLLGLLAIMVLLGSLVVNAFKVEPQVSVQKLPLQQNRARRSLKAVATALTLFRVHTGGWPSQRLGLYALAKNYSIPGWRGPYINWAYKDPWGTPYVYTMPTSPFEVPTLYSCGPDTLPETNDDIRVTEDDFVCAEGTWKRQETPETPLTGEQIHE